MAILNTNELSLMAFSNMDILKLWRDSYNDKMRGSVRQTSNFYERKAGIPGHDNSYSVNRDESTGHVNSTRVTAYTQVAHTNTAYLRGKAENLFRYTEHWTSDSNGHKRVPSTSKYSEFNYSYGVVKTTYGTSSGLSWDQVHRNRAQRTLRGQNYTAFFDASRGRSDEGVYYSNPTNKADEDIDSTFHPYKGTSETINSQTWGNSKLLYSQTMAQDTTRYGYTEVPAYPRIVQVPMYERIPSIAAIDLVGHVNSVPTKPEAYGLKGSVVIENLEIRLASFEKDTTEYSKVTGGTKVLYDLKLTQISRLDGGAVNKVVKTLNGTEDNSMNWDVSALDDGVYELEIKPYNDLSYNWQHTTDDHVKGDKVTKKDYGETTTVVFTIDNHVPVADVTISNYAEFYDYLFGLDTYSDRGGNIHTYLEQIYANAGKKGFSQKGVFAEIDLKDEDVNTYHTIYAGLEQNGKTILEPNYEVKFNEGNKTGDKTGYVFFPISDINALSKKADINIVLKIDEYFDAAHTQKTRTTTVMKGVNRSNMIIYVGLDEIRPKNKIIVSDIAGKTGKNIEFFATDEGLGIKETFYWIVPHGKTPVFENKQSRSADNQSFNFNLAGTWDIYAYSVDKAGNPSVVDPTDFSSYKEGEDVIHGIEIHELKGGLHIKDIVERGETIYPSLEVSTDLTPKEVKIKIEGIGEITPELIFTGEGGIKDYIYQGEITIPEGQALGQYTAIWEVTTEEGYTIKGSEVLEVVADLNYEIGDSGVFHTPQWEENRLTFNAVVSEEKQRIESVFWTGEAFVIKATHYFDSADEISTHNFITKASIIGELSKTNEEYVCDFIDYINLNVWKSELETDPKTGQVTLVQEGRIWNKDMMWRWGGIEPKELLFRIEYANREVRFVKIVVDNRIDFFQLHRAWLVK